MNTEFVYVKFVGLNFKAHDLRVLFNYDRVKIFYTNSQQISHLFELSSLYIRLCPSNTRVLRTTALRRFFPSTQTLFS
jgi:hypothetical protein